MNNEKATIVELQTRMLFELSTRTLKVQEKALRVSEKYSTIIFVF